MSPLSPRRNTAVSPIAIRDPSRRDFTTIPTDLSPRVPDNLTLSGSFTFRPSPNLKLKLGGLYQGYEYWSDGVADPYIRTADSLPGVHRGLGNGGRDLFLPPDWSGAGKRMESEEMQYLVVTHTLSPKNILRSARVAQPAH